jgi:hypothetical protein
VGAARPGFLPRHRLRGLPRKCLQKDSLLAGLQINAVDLQKKRFTLRFRSTKQDLPLDETSYASLMSHVAAWAGVSLWDQGLQQQSPPSGLEEAHAEGYSRATHFSTPSLPSRPWPCCNPMGGRAWSWL